MGWSSIRPYQREVLEAVFAGEDVLAVLPTSGGKSGIYQIPAIVREGLVVVISPLVALMRDQVQRLQSLGICAVELNSYISAIERKKYMDLVRSGTARLLYVSPEKMLSLDPSLFSSTTIQMYAIDESHCISEWGHDFRPAYYRLGKSLDRFPPAQRVALTATATPQVADEIAEVLGIRGPKSRKFRYSPDRPNLIYGVGGRLLHLAAMVESVGLPCLVYGSTRRSVQDAASLLQRNGYAADFYHAGMPKEDRG
jgi:ATP-dependent DNA helicase RecQ